MRIALLVPDNRDEFRRYADPEPYFGTAPTALLEGFAECDNCEVHIVSCVKQPVRSPAQLASNVFYRSVLVPRWGWMRTLYWGCLRGVRRELARIGPDIVHGQGTEKYCALAAARSGYPNVVTVHGNMRVIGGMQPIRSRPFYWLAGRLEEVALSRTDGVVCITNYTRNLVEPLAQRVWLLPNAAEGALFELKRAPLRERLILCVGLICERKNQINLIRALDGCAADLGIRLVFLGSISGEAYGAEFLEFIKPRPWCVHVGFADRNELRSQLERATLLVLPSIEDNCPMVVLEAMASGVPVVAANVGGVPDLVEDGRTGLLCRPDDLPSIRNAVRRMLDDPEFAVNIAEQAKREAGRRFHPKVIARRHLDIYREVISARMESN